MNKWVSALALGLIATSLSASADGTPLDCKFEVSGKIGENLAQAIQAVRRNAQVPRRDIGLVGVISTSLSQIRCTVPLREPLDPRRILPTCYFAEFIPGAGGPEEDSASFVMRLQEYQVSGSDAAHLFRAMKAAGITGDQEVIADSIHCERPVIPPMYKPETTCTIKINLQ